MKKNEQLFIDAVMDLKEKGTEILCIRLNENEHISAEVRELGEREARTLLSALFISEVCDVALEFGPQLTDECEVVAILNVSCLIDEVAVKRSKIMVERIMEGEVLTIEQEMDMLGILEPEERERFVKANKIW